MEYGTGKNPKFVFLIVIIITLDCNSKQNCSSFSMFTSELQVFVRLQSVLDD